MPPRVKKAPIPPNTLIGARVDKAREKAKMTISSLSTAVGLSPSYMAHMIAGRRGLTPERAILAAKALNVDVKEFLRPDQLKMVLAVMEALKA